MASIKLVLGKRPIQDGTYPLSIRIIKDRQASYINLKHYVEKKDWDAKAQRVKKSHPNSVRLNAFLLKKLTEANDTLIEMEAKGKDASARVVKNQIKPAASASFFGFADAFMANMEKQGKYNRVETDRPRLARFRQFLKGQDIAFNEITVPMLNKYRAWLKGTFDITEYTIVNHLIIIRTVYNQGLAANVADVKGYPFGKGKISIKFPDTMKVGLTADEVQKLEKAQLSGWQDHARNVWLFSFYLAGMRIGDVLLLKWGDIRDNRLGYVMGKNKKAGSLKLPEKAVAILDKYRSQEQKLDLVFPELKVLDTLSNLYEVQRKTSYAVKQLNKYVGQAALSVGISKKVTCHISRHTFATLAGDKVPIHVLQHLYRHSSVTTTIGYMGNFTNDKADKALDAVLDF